MLIEREFWSIEEFMGCEVHPINKNVNCVKSKFFFRLSSNKKWLGCDSPNDVDRLVHEGWPEGVERAIAIRDRIVYSLPPPKTLRKRKVHGDFGDEVDIQKIYSGDWDRAWTKTQREMVTGMPVIRILTSFAANCDKSADAMFYKGVTAAILTDILEARGYRVEVVIYSHVQGVYTNGDSSYCQLMVKDSKEPLDLSRLIVTTALSGFFRYHWFKYAVSLPILAFDSLGRTLESPVSKYEKEKDIVISDIYSEHEAVNMIKNVLKSLEERK